MKKTTAATLAAFALVAAFATPAHAFDDPEPGSCEVPIRIDGTDAEMRMLNEISDLRVNLAVVEGHVTSLEAQRDADGDTIAMLGKQVDRKQATIERLRAKLARR